MPQPLFKTSLTLYADKISAAYSKSKSESSPRFLISRESTQS